MADDDDDPAITRIPAFTCPACGHRSNRVGTANGLPGTPEVGNHCGCIACGVPMVFVRGWDSTLRLRVMTDDELAACTEEQRQALARIRAFAEQVFQPRAKAGLN